MTAFLMTLLLSLTGYFLGWILTEHPYFALAGHFPKLNRKPFNCRPCTTFHLIWLLQGIAAVHIESFTFFLIGLACAFIVFILLYSDNNNKIDQ
ncbi:hypothetical protein [Viscerimonas tarda]